MGPVSGLQRCDASPAVPVEPIAPIAVGLAEAQLAVRSWRHSGVHHQGDHSSDCMACSGIWLLDALVPNVIRNIGWLQSIASPRRVRRWQPGLAHVLTDWEAEVAVLVGALSAAVSSGPLTDRALDAFTCDFARLSHNVLAALNVLPGKATEGLPDGRRVASVVAWLKTIETTVAAAVDLIRLATEDELPSAEKVAACSVLPELRPPVGPRVPHGPPPAGLGPRICAA